MYFQYGQEETEYLSGKDEKLGAVIAQVGRVDSAASSAVTACFILVIYGAYFLATYCGSKRILRENG